MEIKVSLGTNDGFASFSRTVFYEKGIVLYGCPIRNQNKRFKDLKLALCLTATVGMALTIFCRLVLKLTAAD